MKKHFFSAILIFTFIFAFVGCTNENTDNAKIKTEDISNRMMYNSITNSVNEIYLKDAFGDDYETQYQDVVLPETEKEVEESLIEDYLIITLCREKGILVKRDTVKKYANTEYDTLSAESSQNRYSNALKKALSNYKISENEYLDLLYNEAYYKYNRNALKNYFRDNLYKDNIELTFEDQFDKYIKSLKK